MTIDELFVFSLYLGFACFYLRKFVTRRRETKIFIVIANAQRFYLRYRAVQGLTKNLRMMRDL